MARKGILTLTGSGGGGGINLPPANPPVPVIPPPPPPTGNPDQTIVMGFATVPFTVFPTTVTRALIAAQNVAMNVVTNAPTVFSPTVTNRIILPLVTNAPIALSPTVTIVGSFTELFAGANSAPWSGAWTNPRTTTAGIVDIQSNQGRLSTGTIGNYAGFAGEMTVAAYSDFEMTGDTIVVGTNVVYPMIGYRSSASWSTTHGSALDSYWLEFKRNEFGYYLYKRVGNTPTLIAQESTFSYSTGDTIHFKINVQGTTHRVVAWKNAESMPASGGVTIWGITVVDASFATGRMYLSANGGPDTLADEVLFDNIAIVGGSVGAPPPPPPPPPPTTTLVRIGATWTDTRPAPSMDSVIAVHDTQAQHIIDFGAGSNLNPSLGVYNWANLDPFVQDMFDAGATKPIIIFCRAPGWMKANNITSNDLPPTPANFGNYATLCAAVAQRYTNVKYFSVWNEMKGFWNAAQNRWDYEGYTAMYNQIWNAVKAVRPDAKIGGPYVILQSGAAGTSWSHGPTSVTFPGGSHDQRQLDVMTYFRDNAVGFDFLSCDGGLENQFGAQIPADPYQQIQKLWGWWVWVRQNIHPTCELMNFETYVNNTVSPPWNYTVAQREDLFIELCRQTAQNVPNPNVTYLTWFHPIFKPQVITAATDFVWANTESTFKAKVQTWHGTAPVTPPPTTTDLLTLFMARYPANGVEIWVDTTGNDSNLGTSSSPKRTIQGAINSASAGSKIRVRSSTYNDGSFTWSGKNGNASNYIQLRLEPGAHVIGNGDGNGVGQFQNCSFIAVWGGEWSGIGSAFELGHLAQNGAHSCAVWGGTYHDFAGHAMATLNTPGRWDFCYNRCYRLANGNPFQASAISVIGMTDIGVPWADGYMNHVVGNVIDATWTEPASVGGAGNITDGNGIILDFSTSFTGRTLLARNLVVGCGGRGLHALGVHHTDAWCNTSLDNSTNLAGTWIGELSIHDATDCHFAWNIGAARVGSNRVGVFQNAGTSTWSDTVFLRGTGGSEGNDPSVAAFNNVNKVSVGPATYFNNYQPGVHGTVSITSVVGFRPRLAQVSTFNPPSNVRAALAAWPDALGVLPPSSGNWAYGAFEGA